MAENYKMAIFYYTFRMVIGVLYYRQFIPIAGS